MQPVDTNRPLPWIWIAYLIVALLAAFAAFQPVLPFSFFADNRQVLAAYAAQFNAGHGLVFNSGEQILLLASPVVMLLLGLLRTGPILDAFALMIGAVSVVRLARRAQVTIVLAAAAGILYAFCWPLLLGRGTALPLMTGLCLLAIDLALQLRWRLAGLILAVAILCSPEALLLALPLLLLALNKQRALQFTAGLLVPLALVLLVLRAYYGPSLWHDLLILRPSISTVDSIWPWLLSVPILAFAAWGWYSRRADEVVATLGAWAVLHLLVVGVLFRVQAGWQYAPVVGAALVLAAGSARLENLRPPLGWAGGALCAVLVVVSAIATIASLRPFSAATLALNTQPTDGIGVMSAADALRVMRTPDQAVIAFDGQLQPELRAMLERGDIQSALIRYAPDLLVTTESARIPATALGSPAWAPLRYQLTNQPNVYRRLAPIGGFRSTAVNIAYGPDIRLISYALDQSSLAPGHMMRVRLDWEMSRPASKPIMVDLWLDSDLYVFAHATDEFSAGIFGAGRWSTYHTLVVSREAWPGPVTLTAGLIINGGTIARLPLTTLPIQH